MDIWKLICTEWIHNVKDLDIAMSNRELRSAFLHAECFNYDVTILDLCILDDVNPPSKRIRLDCAKIQYNSFVHNRLSKHFIYDYFRVLTFECFSQTIRFTEVCQSFPSLVKLSLHGASITVSHQDTMYLADKSNKKNCLGSLKSIQLKNISFALVKTFPSSDKKEKAVVNIPLFFFTLIGLYCTQLEELHYIPKEESEFPLISILTQ
jgi:hypothetical protein